MEDRRRCKNSRRKAALAVNINALPDDILELVFMRLPSPIHLVRAACTCKRWRHVIAADDGRLIRSLHGAPSSHIVGHYRVKEHSHHAPRPPGSNPVFVPSSPSPWADILSARNLKLALDFLPQYGNFCWELTDVHGGLLLLVSPLSRPRLLICDPLVRRYKEIPPSVWFHGCDFLGVFLRDGEEEDAGTRVSMSNFRVSCALYHSGMIRSCVFSSASGGRWTSGGGGSSRGSMVICRNGYWGALGGNICFAGCSDNGSIAYWTIRKNRIILALNKETGELSHSVMQDGVNYPALGDRRHVPKYVYELLWPPTIRACLS